ncbi:MAG: cob(I)yrinic acid a,c-diamide adenosyltransferase [Bacilli bacterium]
MKVYTKTGDKGTTSIIGERVFKDDLRVDAYGTIDTLNSHLNLVRSIEPKYDEYLIRISNYLFIVSHDLAQTDSSKYKVKYSEIDWLEECIDKFTTKIENFNHFVLPGGNITASNLHICRCICRECERKIVKVSKKFDFNGDVLTYINRLSDFIYIIACYENTINNIELIEVKM